MNPWAAHGSLVASTGARGSSAISSFSVAGEASGKRSTPPSSRAAEGIGVRSTAGSAEARSTGIFDANCKGTPTECVRDKLSCDVSVNTVLYPIGKDPPPRDKPGGTGPGLPHLARPETERLNEFVCPVQQQELEWNKQKKRWKAEEAKLLRRLEQLKSRSADKEKQFWELHQLTVDIKTDCYRLVEQRDEELRRLRSDLAEGDRVIRARKSTLREINEWIRAAAEKPCEFTETSERSRRISNVDGKKQDGLVPDNEVYENENLEGEEVPPPVPEKTNHIPPIKTWNFRRREDRRLRRKNFRDLRTIRQFIR